MNHLIIYGKDFTSEDKDFIIKVLSYTAIPLGMVKFVDINAVDSFLPSKLNFCFNNTHGIVARSVCSKEGYKAKEFLTGNVIFHNDKFAFFNVPASLREIRASDKLKDDLYARWAELIDNWFNFNNIVDVDRKNALLIVRLIADGAWFDRGLGMLTTSEDERKSILSISERILNKGVIK